MSEQEEHLLHDAYVSLVPPGKTSRRGVLVVREFARVGRSGARMFEVCRNDVGIPVIVKMGITSRIAREYAATRSVCDFFHEVRTIREPVHAGDQAAIAYDHLAHGKDERLRVELHDLIESNQLKPQALQRLLGQLLDHLRYCTTAASLRRVRIDEAFERYYWNLATSGHILRSAFGLRRLTDQTVRLGEVELMNPYRLLSNWRRREMPFLIGPIHGDLHPRNVIVEPSTNHCLLIDFEFATPDGVSLVDYALMELSLRHFQFPTFADPFAELAVDLVLARTLSIEVEDALARAARSYGRELPLLPAYRRALHSVATIRQHLLRTYEERAGGSAPLHRQYLITQMMLLFSALRFADINPVSVAINCAVCATQLASRP